MEDNFEVDMKKMGYGLDSTGSELDSVTGSYEHGEHLAFHSPQKILEQTKGCWHLTEDSVA